MPKNLNKIIVCLLSILLSFSNLTSPVSAEEDGDTEAVASFEETEIIEESELTEEESGELKPEDLTEYEMIPEATEMPDMELPSEVINDDAVNEQDEIDKEESEEVLDEEESLSYSNVVASGECGTDAAWALDSDGTLTISGSGAISDYKYTYTNGVGNADTPWNTYRESIKSIVIESGITKIGNYNFCFLVNLSNVSIADTVSSIGNNAFWRCDTLAEIKLPDSVTSVDRDAFLNCYALKHVTLSSRLTRISIEMFAGCESLNEIELPSGIEYIYSYAFAGCESLNSISLPAGLKYLYDGIFLDCSSLTTLEIPQGVHIWASGGRMFEGCSCLKKITIPDDWSSIPDSFFEDCTSLEEFVIPQAVTSIGEKAFYGCNNLAVLNIPGAVTSIGKSAFYECNNLKRIVIPNGVTTIDYSTFYGCSSLETVVIPSSVKVINGSAFYGCTGLKTIGEIGSSANVQIGFGEEFDERYAGSVTEDGISFSSINKTYLMAYMEEIELPEGIKTIGDYAFCYLSDVVQIRIPDGVTSIGKGAFYYCDSLTSLIIPASVTSIGEFVIGAVDTLDIYYGGSKEEWQNISIGDQYSNGFDNATVHYNSDGPEDDTDVIIMDSVKYKIIGADANGFAVVVGYSEEISGQIIIPEKVDEYFVREIRKNAFSGAVNISAVVLPSTIASIGKYAFNGCTHLEKLEQCKSVLTIEQYAFKNCYRLNEIVYNGTLQNWDSITIMKGNECLSKVLVDSFEYGNLRRNEVWSFVNPEFYNYKSDYVKQLENRLDLAGRALLSDEYNSKLYNSSTPHCHGMAVTAILNKYDHRFTTGNLSDIPYDAKSREFIMDYYMTQFQPEYQYELINGSLLSQTEMLKQLDDAGEIANKGGLPSIVSYPGHTVVCYGKEDGNYEYSGVKYPYRALIYDSNYLGYFGADFCIYYDLAKGIYTIPAYAGKETYIPQENKTRVIGDWNYVILSVSNDLGLLDPIQYGDEFLPYEANWKSLTVIGNKTYDVAENMIKSTAKSITKYFDSSTPIDSSDYSPNLHILYPEDCEEIIIPESLLNKDYKFIFYDNKVVYYVSVESAKSVRLKSNGNVIIDDNNGAFTILTGDRELESGKINCYELEGVTEGSIKTSFINKELRIIADNMSNTVLSGINGENIEKYNIGDNTSTVVVTSNNLQMSVDEQIDLGDVLPEDIPLDFNIPEGIWITNVKDAEYTGTALKPEFRVYDHKKLLKSGADYTVTYKNTTKAYHIADPDNLTAADKKKAPQIIIKSNKKGNYTGTKTVYFSIEQVDLNSESITIDPLSAQATGKPLSPLPVLYFNGKKLKNKTDYTVSYENYGDRTAEGVHTVTVSGKGNFSGTREVTVNVAPTSAVSVSRLKVSVKSLKYEKLTADAYGVLAEQR